MDGHTRKLILRLQSEDLAALWSASTANGSEIDATLRVYRRQLSKLDHYLNEARQAGTIEDATEAVNDEAVASLRQIVDGSAPILTELGDVHQPGVAYARCDTLSLFTASASIPPIVDATTARPLPQASERPVVRFPQEPVHPVVRLPPITSNVEERERMKKLMQEKHETEIQGGQEEEAREEIERKDRIRKQVEALMAPFEKAICNSSSVSNKPATTATTNLKRSANHLAAPAGPPSKKRASAIIKEESKFESGSSGPKGTIKDKLEDLLQSSRALSSPTHSAASAKRRGLSRGIPPRHKLQKPAARSGTYQRYTASGPTVSDVSALPSVLARPNMPPPMMGFNIGHHRQPFSDLGPFHQSTGFPQEFTEAATIATALETVFSTASSENQRQMLGVVLYPKIEKLQPQLAGKLTGMILEMDNFDILHLIANDVALHNKVDEALRVYNDYLKSNNVESV
ncbi:hypothetical protein KCU92_g8805, partial [Aureobasidium melanogenum]|jgi:hypothetical protein